MGKAMSSDITGGKGKMTAPETKHTPSDINEIEEYQTMSETDAYELGRNAFINNASRTSCPFPAPFMPPRSREDVGLDPACNGAFWLDGFEQARDGVKALTSTKKRRK
jgi:hypothetical protein